MDKLKHIQRLYPDLDIDAVAVNTVGQNSDILIINEDLIFRFPRYDEGKKRLAGEIELLKALQGRLPLPIPNPLYVADDFVGYKMIRGKPLWRDSVTPKNRNQVARQLGEFLAALHRVQLADLPDRVPHDDQGQSWIDFYQRVKDNLFQFMRPDAIESVRQHFEPVLSNFFYFKPALRHGDFGTVNVLWDGQAITGIIDFGNCAIGDISIDLAGLLSGYGEEFMAALNYPDIDVHMDRIQFYRGTFALFEALHGYENDDAQAFQAGMQNYAL